MKTHLWLRICVAFLLSMALGGASWAAKRDPLTNALVNAGAPSKPAAILPTTGTIDVTNQYVYLSGYPASINQIVVDYAGTFAITMAGQLTFDGTTYFTVNGTPYSGGAVVASVTGTGQYTYPASGSLGFRVARTAFTSGSATITINVGVASKNPSLGQMPPAGTFRLANPASATVANFVGTLTRCTSIRWPRQILDLRDAVDAYCPAEQGTVYWYSTSGLDSHDGLDGLGFAVASGTWTSSTKTLTKTGAFTSYVWQPGDRVYVSGGTGSTIGLYPVASRVSNDAITLTTSIGPDAADVTTSTGPRKTMSKMQDTIDNASAATTFYCKRGDVWRVVPPRVAVSASDATHVSYTTANLTANSIVRTIAVGQFIVLIDASGVHQTTFVTAKSGTTTTQLTTNDTIAITPTYVGPAGVIDCHNRAVSIGAYGVGKKPPVFTAFEQIGGYPYSNPSGDLRRWTVALDPNTPGSNTSGDGSAGVMRMSGTWAAMKNEGNTDDPYVRVNTDADMFGQSEQYTLQSSGTVSGGTIALNGAFISGEAISTPNFDPSTLTTSALVQAQLDKIFPSGSTTVTGTSLATGYTITFSGQYANTNIQTDLNLSNNAPTGGGTVACTKVQDGIYPVPLDSGAWRVSGTTITMMQPWHGQTMNGVNKMEICAQNSYSFFYTNVDKCSLRGLRMEGYGLGQYDFTNHRYSGGQGATTGLMRDEPGWTVSAYNGAGTAFVLSDCELYYAGRHTFVGAGAGIYLVQRTRQGMLGRDTIMDVAYNAAGGQTGLFFDNEWLCGALPSKTGAQTSNPFGSNYGNTGSGTDAHTDAIGSHYVGLYVDWGSKYRPSAWQSYPASPANINPWNNGFTGTDPINCTSFVVNLDCRVRNALPRDIYACPSGTGSIFGRSNFGLNTIVINSRIECAYLSCNTATDYAFWGLSSSQGQGVGWNNNWQFRFDRGMPHLKQPFTYSISSVASGNGQTWDWHEYNSRIELLDECGFGGVSGFCGRLAWAVGNGANYSGALPSNLRLFNSILVNRTTEEPGAGSNTSYIAINDNQTGGQTTAQNNAYFGSALTGVAATDAYLSYSADPYPYALPLNAAWIHPSYYDGLVVPASQFMSPWNTWRLEYDDSFMPRNVVKDTIGPRAWRQ